MHQDNAPAHASQEVQTTIKIQLESEILTNPTYSPDLVWCDFTLFPKLEGEFCMRLFICALWSPAGKGLTSWLSFVVSSCEFVTFSLVSWVRCGTCLYRFFIFAPLLTLKGKHFNDLDELRYKSTRILYSYPVEWFDQVSRQWIKRHHK